MHSGCVDTQDLRGLSNGRQFAGGLLNRRLKPWNVSIAAQTADMNSREPFSSRRLTTLTIQDAGDNIVGIGNGKAAKKGDRVFVGADTSRLKTRQGENLRALLAGDPAPARKKLLKHVSEIRMMPQQAGDGKGHYVAKGEWKLLRNEQDALSALESADREIRVVAGVGFESTTFGL